MTPLRLVWRRRFLGPALTVSLALNAFFLGAVAIDVVHTVAPDPYPHADGSSLYRLDLRWLDDRLPDAAMAKVAADVGQGVSGADARFRHLHELRESLGQLVAAPRPDRAAIDATLVEIRAELDRLMTESQATTITSVLALSPDDRAGFAAADAPTD